MIKRFLSLALAMAAVLGLCSCSGRVQQPEEDQNNPGGSSTAEFSPYYEEPAPGSGSELDFDLEPAEEELFPDLVRGEDYAFTIKLSFAGDCALACMLDETTPGSFNDYAENNEPEYFLQNVRSVFEADDYTIVNLENVFSDRELEPVPKTDDPAFWFKSGTSNTQILTSSGVEGVSLANNHTGDYGDEGTADTIQAVTDAGLLYGDEDTILYLEKHGFRIAVICHGLWEEQQVDDIIARIHSAERDSDYQVVFYHGGTEAQHEPEEWRVRASRKLVDSGADLVLGNHPHWLQPMESYNGAEILYSLANFCFGGHRQPENRTIIYQVTLAVDYIGTLVASVSEIIPCYVYTSDYNNYCPAPITNETERQRVLDFMNGLCDSPL